MLVTDLGLISLLRTVFLICLYFSFSQVKQCSAQQSNRVFAPIHTEFLLRVICYVFITEKPDACVSSYFSALT